ncbi:superoxide dismutase [candidate division KSB1 bacterium]|nr:superoxide dismutase [candidate division KSB1 bacterium]
MKKQVLTAVTIIALYMVSGTTSVYAHCEIPCGIYNDQLRVDLVKEHITTIEKSMNQIIELSKQSPLNYNQLVRWIDNKEEHANKIQDIVYQYFMTQRIKAADPADKAAYDDYVGKLSYLHQMLVAAMKCKQTTDLTNIDTLRMLIDKFANVYFSEHDKEHMKEHQK